MREWLETAEDIIVIGRQGDRIDIRTELDPEDAIPILDMVLAMLEAVEEGGDLKFDKLH